MISRKSKSKDDRAELLLETFMDSEKYEKELESIRFLALEMAERPESPQVGMALFCAADLAGYLLLEHMLSKGELTRTAP